MAATASLDFIRRQKKFIEDAAGADSWKVDHDEAMEVIQLENVFRILEVSVDCVLRADNVAHEKAAREDNPKWFDGFEKAVGEFFVLARKVLTSVKRRAVSLKAGAYRDAVLTPERVTRLEGQVDDILDALKEE